MKYIEFESWTITWLHEGNVIVEDQLTHNFKRGSRTAPPKVVFYAAVQNVSRSWQWFCSKMPLTLTSRFMETWLVEVNDSIVAVVYVFVYSVVKCVGGAADNMLGIADFAQGYSKYSELKNFHWGLKETVSSEKYILQPRAHSSILPMPVDTLPLNWQLPSQNQWIEAILMSKTILYICKWRPQDKTQCALS